jgi:quercetin dioxygenase-like cupin family protein
MTRKRLALIGIGLVATTGFAWAATAARQTDPLDAVKVAGDTHKLAFENAFVRVLDVHLPPGKVEPRHRHPHGLSVYFTDWDAKVQVDGATAEVHPRKAGTFAWSDAVIHTVQNVGKTEGHVLRVELKF